VFSNFRCSAGRGKVVEPSMGRMLETDLERNGIGEMRSEGLWKLNVPCSLYSCLDLE
jgi:hypothetical protein